MTPARRKALQWFHDRGEVELSRDMKDRPTSEMMMAMVRGGQLQWINPGSQPIWSLTDKGRRMLHGDRE